jgi:hypothetical protein
MCDYVDRRLTERDWNLINSHIEFLHRTIRDQRDIKLQLLNKRLC